MKFRFETIGKKSPRFHGERDFNGSWEFSRDSRWAGEGRGGTTRV